MECGVDGKGRSRMEGIRVQIVVFTGSIPRAEQFEIGNEAFKPFIIGMYKFHTRNPIT